MGYFVYKTKKSPLNVILNQARLKWNKYRIRELMVKEFFYFKVDNEKRCNDTLSNGPWTLVGVWFT